VQGRRRRGPNDRARRPPDASATATARTPRAALGRCLPAGLPARPREQQRRGRGPARPVDLARAHATGERREQPPLRRNRVRVPARRGALRIARTRRAPLVVCDLARARCTRTRRTLSRVHTTGRGLGPQPQSVCAHLRSPYGLESRFRRVASRDASTRPV
jgi:hypothetical protein